MSWILKSLIFITFCVTVAHSVFCYSCDNESCGRASGYAIENCGDHVSQCYILKNLDKQPYRAGCLPNPKACEEIKKLNEKCENCDSNGCNFGLSIAVPPIGGGTTYNSASQQITTKSLISMFGICCFTFISAAFIFA